MDRRIADIARTQYGLIAVWQLRLLGHDKHAVSHLVACNILVPVLEGVYAVGGFDPDHRCQMVMACVLSAGPGAAASHVTALWLLDYRPRIDFELHVTSPRHVRPRPGMHMHKAKTLSDDFVIVRHRIRCTAQTWTLVDAGSYLTPEQLANVMHEAEFRDGLDRDAIRLEMKRRPRKHGACTVRAALAMNESGQAGTGSPLEDAWLRAFRSLDLADPEFRDLYEPEVNPWINVNGVNMRPDFLFRRHRVVVEVDGKRVHQRARTANADRYKERALKEAGFVVIRVGWRDIHRTPRRMFVNVARHLPRLS